MLTARFAPRGNSPGLGPVLLTVFGLVLAINLLGASYVALEGDARGEVRKATGLEVGSRPQHLVQTRLFIAVLGLATRGGWDGPPWVPLQTLNALLGAGAAVLLVLLGVRAGVDARAAFLASAVWALSWAPWFHARTAETGTTPLPFLLAAFLLVLPSGARPGVLRGVAAGTLFGVAVLLSLTCVLLLPAFLLAAAHRGPRLRIVAAAGAVALVVGVPFAWVAGANGIRDAGAFVGWLASHPDAPGLAAKVDPLSFLRAATGLGRLLFPVSDGETAMKAVLTGQSVRVGVLDGLTLARNVLGAAALIGSSLAGAWLGRRRPVVMVLVLAVLPTAFFNVYWLGSDPQFWLPVYPFLLTLAAPFWIRRAPRLGVALLLAFLFLTNRLIGPPTPLGPSGDARWQTAASLALRVEQNALVITPGIGRTPFEFLSDFRPDVEVVDLRYAEPRDLRGESFVEWLVDRVRAGRAASRTVYCAALEESLDPAFLGAWGYVVNSRGIARASLCERLTNEFETPVEVADGTLVWPDQTTSPIEPGR